MSFTPRPPRHDLRSHPHAAECREILALACRTYLERARRDDRDLPFGVVLTRSLELQVLEHGPEPAEDGLLEEVEARLWSLRPVLRACARCCHVELSSGAESMEALRVQLEHVDGPPLDVYLPVADQEGWWVELGESTLWAP
jgi:hypothetical protein